MSRINAPSTQQRNADKAHAIKWATRVLATEHDVYILDTETTGLDDAEIVQLAIVDRTGATIVNTLVKPQHPEKLLQKGRGGKCAFDIHGIHPDMLKDAPDVEDLRFKHFNFQFLQDSVLIIYNADYDFPLLSKLLKQGGRTMPQPRTVECAMLNYADFVGDWDDYHGNYRWQRLPAAPGVKAHDALGDCLSTLALIKMMAGVKP